MIGVKSSDSIGLLGFWRARDAKKQKAHARLFNAFDLEAHIPSDHLVRGIDRFLDLDDLHEEMRAFYSHTGRPSINPGLMIRMLVVVRAAVLDGAGIGFFVEQDVADDIATGRLIRLLENWTPPRPGFSLYYPGRRNPSAGFAAFLAMVQEKATRPISRG